MIFLTPTWKPITFSTYSDYFVGRAMSNGVRYSHTRISCASNLVPLGTKIELRVNNRRVIATVTDRINKRFSRSRIDLSGTLWLKLGGGEPGLMRGYWRKL